MPPGSARRPLGSGRNASDPQENVHPEKMPLSAIPALGGREDSRASQPDVERVARTDKNATPPSRGRVTRYGRGGGGVFTNRRERLLTESF